MNVELEVDRNHHSGDLYSVEVIVHLHSKTLQAGMRADDMRAAIDLVYPKLERQLVKSKEKIQRTRRKPAAE